MGVECLRFRSTADRLYWQAFEARLAAKPATADDAAERSDLLNAAYEDMTHRPAGTPDAASHADLVYRLRYELGPTVGAETLADVRRELAEQKSRLLREGVSPRLLG